VHRVAKALLHALRHLPSTANVDLDLAAEIEAISFGWAALPFATDPLSQLRDVNAICNKRLALPDMRSACRISIQ